jgi:hypothetical protein
MEGHGVIGRDYWDFRDLRNDQEETDSFFIPSLPSIPSTKVRISVVLRLSVPSVSAFVASPFSRFRPLSRFRDERL